MKHAFRDRIKITGTGKLLRRPMRQGHFKAKKSTKQKRNLKGTVEVHKADRDYIRQNF
ncbi:MAG: 50S ribosomal protein L35 [Candidatus Pacebacteria bacterium]|nr:50S ribosomal protein L35 [Candidatus Paceibacterota bacterium]